jgi:hypothetical protein
MTIVGTGGGNGGGGSSTPTNNAPVITSEPETDAEQDEAYIYDVNAGLNRSIQGNFLSQTHLFGFSCISEFDIRCRYLVMLDYFFIS